MEKPRCPRCNGFLYLEEVPHTKSEVARCVNCGHYITKSYDGYFDREAGKARSQGRS